MCYIALNVTFLGLPLLNKKQKSLNQVSSYTTTSDTEKQFSLKSENKVNYALK